MKQVWTYIWQHSIIALLCVSTVVVPAAIMETGCTSAQVTTVVTDITKFAPVVVNVLQLACAFTPGSALCATGAAELNKTIADLETALTAYQAAVAAGTATSSTWNALNAVFTTFESQTAAIFDLFRISGAAAQSTALAVAASAGTLLSLIEALFPSAPVTPAAMRDEAARPKPVRFATLFPGAAPMTAGGVTFFNLPAWQKDYNKKVDAANKAIPTVAKQGFTKLVHVNVAVK
jgi:hypothetical protein